MNDTEWTRRGFLQAGALAALGLWAWPRGVLAGEAPSAEALARAKPLVTSLNAFAADLYTKLEGDAPNVFFSPASLSTALAMTLCGADGQTRAQMRRVLHHQQPWTELRGAYRAFLSGLSAEGAWTMAVANRLWGQTGYPFEPALRTETREVFGAELEGLDFGADPEAARGRINGWVSEQTRALIPELLKAGSINSLTKLVLTNAIYFKGTWSERFDPAQTYDAPFHLADGGQASCRMMGQTTRLPYGQLDDAQVVKLPYAGDAISFLAVLPAQGATLRFTPDALARWRGALRPTKVRVELPRFSLDESYTLNDTLKQLGMPDAFDFDKADFSKVHAADELAITTVAHQARLTVDEEGSEAAAATGVVLGQRSMPPRFTADRPFLFLIQDDRTGAVLFAGRLGNPA